MTDRLDLTLSFLKSDPVAAARTLEELAREDVAAFLATIPARIAGPAVAALPNWKAAAVLELMQPTNAAGVLDNLPYDDALGTARAMDAGKREALLAAAPRRTAERINASLRYPDGTVGALMDPSAPILSEGTSVESALRFLREGRNPEVSHLFVHGEGKRFIGAIPVGALMYADAQRMLGELAETRAQPLSSRAMVSIAANDPEWDDFPVRPVVGRQRQLIGGLARKVIRHAQTKDAAAHPQQGPASIIANIFSMYLHTCQGLGAIAARSGQTHYGDPMHGERS